MNATGLPPRHQRHGFMLRTNTAVGAVAELVALALIISTWVVAYVGIVRA